MATTLDPIRYVVYASHLSSDDSVAPGAYARDLTAALRAAYPSREVEVRVRGGVSGVGAGLQGEPEGVDAGVVAYLSEQVLVRGICSEPGCGRIRGTALELCPTHYQQRRRTGSTKPVRRPAAARIGVRLSAEALAALGDRPAERAREVLEVWARSQR